MFVKASSTVCLIMVRIQLAAFRHMVIVSSTPLRNLPGHKTSHHMSRGTSPLESLSSLAFCFCRVVAGLHRLFQTKVPMDNSAEVWDQPQPPAVATAGNSLAASISWHQLLSLTQTALSKAVQSAAPTASQGTPSIPRKEAKARKKREGQLAESTWVEALAYNLADALFDASSTDLHVCEHRTAAAGHSIHDENAGQHAQDWDKIFSALVDWALAGNVGADGLLVKALQTRTDMNLLRALDRSEHGFNRRDTIADIVLCCAYSIVQECVPPLDTHRVNCFVLLTYHKPSCIASVVEHVNAIMLWGMRGRAGEAGGDHFAVGNEGGAGGAARGIVLLWDIELGWGTLGGPVCYGV